jgi:hypothetical protein
MWIWASGEVKADGAGAALEVEFEGPGQHRLEVFEDLIAEEARMVYDRYPGVLLLEWPFSEHAQPGSGADLLSRVRFGSR